MNRLWIKLTLAFVAIALVAVGVVALLASKATTTGFEQYVVANGMMAEAPWVSTLEDYYATNGGWDGVDTLLVQISPGAGLGRGRGGQGTGGPNFTIVDENGRVVASKTGEGVGQTLLPSALSQGLPLTVDGRRIGTLLNLRPAAPVLDAQGQAFLQQVRSSLVWAGLAALALALVLGIAISQRLTSPLERLTRAAGAIAAGKLSQQVQVRGSDEIGQLGSAFNHMADSLARAETLRRNMVADVAHELRTPLTVLQGNLQAILDGVYPMDVEQVASLYDETRLLARLVEDLHELTLADAGQLKLGHDQVDMAALAQAVVTNFRPAAEAAGVRLGLECTTNSSEVLGDADRLSQVLRNLLGNAIRHTPPGGKVSVTVSSDDEWLLVAVRDTGTGIDPQDLPHVFDRFYRGDKSRSRPRGGSGLGLAIVRQLVIAHGGEISVASQQGAGSTFTVRLPRAGANTVTAAEAP